MRHYGTFQPNLTRRSAGSGGEDGGSKVRDRLANPVVKVNSIPRREDIQTSNNTTFT